MSKRVELTLPDDVWDRVELARGDVPRALWIRRAIAARLVPSARYVESQTLPAPSGELFVPKNADRPPGYEPVTVENLTDEVMSRGVSERAKPKPAALKRGSEIVMRFRCPVPGCPRRFGSAAAICADHACKAVEG